MLSRQLWEARQRRDAAILVAQASYDGLQTKKQELEACKVNYDSCISCNELIPICCRYTQTVIPQVDIGRAIHQSPAHTWHEHAGEQTLLAKDAGTPITTVFLSFVGFNRLMERYTAMSRAISA